MSTSRDSNPGLEFSIPGFGIVEFPIPGSRRDWRTLVQATKIATWVTVTIFELQVCTIVHAYGFNADVLYA